MQTSNVSVTIVETTSPLFCVCFDTGYGRVHNFAISARIYIFPFSWRRGYKWEFAGWQSAENCLFECPAGEGHVSKGGGGERSEDWYHR